MNAEQEDKNQQNTLSKGLEVIIALGRQDCSSITDLTKITGMNRWLIRRIVITLESLGYVKREGRAIRLLPKVLDLGYAYLSSVELWKIADPLIVDLVDSVGLSSTLSVLEGHDIVYLIRRASTHRTVDIPIQVGTRMPAHCTASGRVLLQQLSDAELRDWLHAKPLAKITPRTETDPEHLFSQIQAIRAENWCQVEDELALGSCAVAMGVRDRLGAVVASISLSGTAKDVLREQTREALADTVSRLESILHRR